ncbi:hypothetical protein HDR58_02480 [bacterium]|nr:hypothetical protein [bacterium]
MVMFTCACDSEQSQILFNKHPFTQETIATTQNIFNPGDRIYYLITLPEPVVTKKLLIQVVKVGGGKDERLGYELVWTKRVKLKDEQIYYFTDYVVFNNNGVYIMKVYSQDNPTKILTTAQFHVKN